MDVSEPIVRQQEICDDLQDEIDDFQLENSIRIVQIIQSESLYKNKCHLTITLDYILNEDIKKMEVLN